MRFKLPLKRGWDKSPSLFLFLDCRARRSGCVGSTRLIPSAFTALLNCAEVGRRNRILTNDRFLSHSLILFSDLLVESADFFAVDGRTDPSSD